MKNPNGRGFPAAAAPAGLLLIGALVQTALAADPAPERGLSAGPIETIEHDSNLGRTAGVAGAPALADTLYSTGLGAELHESYGREQVDATAAVSRVLYQNSRQLDYTQENFDAGLSAQLPLDVAANLRATHTAQMVHFGDIGGIVADVISRDSATGNLAFPLLANWRAVIGGDFSRSGNSSDSLRGQNDRTTEGMAGLRYTTSAANHIDLLGRRLHDRRPNYTAGSQIGPGFDESVGDVSADWTIAGVSQVHGHAGFVRHTGDRYQYATTVAPIRTLSIDHDFAGPAFDLSYAWQVSGATSITLLGARVDGAVGDNNYLSAVSHTYRITPAWKYSTKTEVDLFAQRSRRDYAADPSIASLRTDQGHDVGMVVIWTPRRWLQTKLQLHQERWSSTVALFSYRDTVAILDLKAFF